MARLGTCPHPVTVYIRSHIKGYITTFLIGVILRAIYDTYIHIYKIRGHTKGYIQLHYEYSPTFPEWWQYPLARF